MVAAGVTRVTGRVVGDGSRYDDEFFVDSWGDDVRVVEAGPFDALLVNDGWTTTSVDDVTDDPALGAAEVFVELLRERGVRVGKGAASETMPFADEIASVQSQPLSAIVQEMLLTSDDNTAEMLVKEIGVEVSGVGHHGGGDRGDHRPADDVGRVDRRVAAEGRLGAVARQPDHLRHVAERAAAERRRRCARAPACRSPVSAARWPTCSPVRRSKGGCRRRPARSTDVKSLAGYMPVVGGGTIEFTLVQNQTGVDQGAYLAVWDDLATALASYPAGVTERPRSRRG